jgi:malate dehydrogenase (oxaloacetate-decarboxylating)
MASCAPKTPLALATPCLNRSLGVTHEERRKLGFSGRLPEYKVDML